MKGSEDFLDTCRTAASQLINLGITVNCLAHPELMMPGATSVSADVRAEGATIFVNAEGHAAFNAKRKMMFEELLKQRQLALRSAVIPQPEAGASLR